MEVDVSKDQIENNKPHWIAMQACSKTDTGKFCIFFVVCGFFSKSTFSKNSFINTIRVSNSLDPDQAQLSVGPDLGPNCL